ncbi:MAG: hypothetical protein EOO43_05185 [Flavobacterium sp.]|nr:MAG: hypothetical protein EOO43_05185 [Flavobacterium sp.]
MLTIVGGTYYEYCEEPFYYEIYGSGLRAAIALSNIEKDIKFVSCAGQSELENIDSIVSTHNFKSFIKPTQETIQFHYLYPLAKPTVQTDIPIEQIINLDEVHDENILYYGMIEATVSVHGNYVVYDPQNSISFKNTNSSAKQLAIILNKSEALTISGLTDNDDLNTVGKALLEDENANVVVIKNGSKGALVFENDKVYEIPVFKTERVWPIGSGDIFSAVFSWKWVLERNSCFDAAMYASNLTAQFCETRHLPLRGFTKNLVALPIVTRKKKIYLAGPFFSMPERWLINRLREALIDFGNEVFSPMHDVGFDGTPYDIVNKDLGGLQECDVILAVLNRLDTGTIFEIGYAKALSKRVVILTENIDDKELLMMVGAGCEIVEDFTTSVYKASW